MSAALVPLFESIPFHAAAAMVTELRAPWGFVLPDTHIASLRATLEGSWLLEVPPLAPIVMRPGDIAIFPGGSIAARTRLRRDAPGSPSPAEARAPSRDQRTSVDEVPRATPRIAMDGADEKRLRRPRSCDVDRAIIQCRFVPISCPILQNGLCACGPGGAGRWERPPARPGRGLSATRRPERSRGAPSNAAPRPRGAFAFSGEAVHSHGHIERLKHE